MWAYAVLGALIGYFSRFLLVILIDKIKEDKDEVKNAR